MLLQTIPKGIGATRQAPGRRVRTSFRESGNSVSLHARVRLDVPRIICRIDGLATEQNPAKHSFLLGGGKRTSGMR
jgi:hypothetical protein